MSTLSHKHTVFLIIFLVVGAVFVTTVVVYGVTILVANRFERKLSIKGVVILNEKLNLTEFPIIELEDEDDLLILVDFYEIRIVYKPLKWGHAYYVFHNGIIYKCRLV